MDSREQIMNARNPNQFESGFGDDSQSGGDPFGFGNTDGQSNDDPFGFGNADGDDPFGFGNTQQGNTNNNDPFGFNSNQQNDSFGNFTLGQQGQAQGQLANGQQHQNTDAMTQMLTEGAKGTLEVIKTIFGTVPNRNYDDWGKYSDTIIKLGIGYIVGAVIITLLGIVGDIKVFQFFGMPYTMILSGVLCTGTGVIGITGAAEKIINADDTHDLPSSEEVQNMNVNDSSTDDLFSDLLGDSNNDGSSSENYDFNFDDIMSGLDDDDTEEVEETVEEPDSSIGNKSDSDSSVDDFFSRLKAESADIKNPLDYVPADIPIINREFLFKTFVSPAFFKVNTPDFTKITTYTTSDEKFKDAETRIIEAFASASAKDVNEVAGESNAYMDSFTESMFCYQFKFTRINKIRVNTKAFADEIKAYFLDFDTTKKREMDNINAEVEVEGRWYIITVSKPVPKSVITLGDCLQVESVKNEFLDPGNKLPTVCGITEYGEPIVRDAKLYDSIMIVGKPRSGKSWYVNSLVLQLQVFNLPEDVQFLYIDPKKTYLFETLSLMPHCCGLHDGTDTFEVLDGVINNEGPRRKKLMVDNQCDTIWELREKGIKLPVLYIVIDEYITIAGYYRDRSKELSDKITTIITQFPSQGVRILIVPHRAQGVVDKTARALFSYSAAVKSDTSIVKETLDIQKWDRNLANPGDIALRLADKSLFVRGMGIATSDTENAILIKNIAKAFYKMGVEIPDMTTIGYGYNRDESKIKEELEIDSGTHITVQYDATKIKDELNDL